MPGLVLEQVGARGQNLVDLRGMPQTLPRDTHAGDLCRSTFHRILVGIIATEVSAWLCEWG